MDKEVYFQRLSNAFLVVFKALNPTQRIFRLKIFLLPTWLLLVLIFAFQEFDGLSLSIAYLRAYLSEFALIFLLCSQLLIDSTLSSIYFTEWQTVIERFVEECKSIKKDEEHWDLTLNHCKTCYFGLIFWWISMALLGLASITINFFDENRLTYGYYIIFLPFTGCSLIWFLSYIYQVFIVFCTTTFYASYYLLIFVLFNHAAYEVDASILHVKGLNLQTELSEHGKLTGIGELRLLANPSRNVEIPEPEPRAQASGYRAPFRLANPQLGVLAQHCLLIDKRLKSVVEKTNCIQTWQNDIQFLLQYTFLVEFAIISFVLCFVLFSLMGTDSGSILVLIAPCMFLPRLFVYCFMGTRITVKIEELTAVLYDSDWHLMNPKQRKDLQLTILMSQNMKAFNGVFMPVNLQTFTEVLKFSYSLLALLRSLN